MTVPGRPLLKSTTSQGDLLSSNRKQVKPAEQSKPAAQKKHTPLVASYFGIPASRSQRISPETSQTSKKVRIKPLGLISTSGTSTPTLPAHPQPAPLVVYNSLAQSIYKPGAARSGRTPVANCQLIEEAKESARRHYMLMAEDHKKVEKKTVRILLSNQRPKSSKHQGGFTLVSK